MGDGGELREQDRFLPIANVARIMKKAIPSQVHTFAILDAILPICAQICLFLTEIWSFMSKFVYF